MRRRSVVTALTAASLVSVILVSDATAAPEASSSLARHWSMEGSRAAVERRRRGLLRLPKGQLPAPRFLPQPLDHFEKDSPIWQQAYYVNDTFFKPGSSAPVFLCVGGEGPPMDGSAVVSSVHCSVATEWLQELGALMFAIEHRFYGCHNASACPVPDLTVPGALRTLTSRQALHDIADFVVFATKEYGLTKANKWVTWGGSYPGMLAGWARLKFPDLIHASVSSSAPVRAELNMHGYYNVVAEAYAVDHEEVGGSPLCRSAIAKGHWSIGQMFQTSAGRTELAKVFGKDADWYAVHDNQVLFAGVGVAAFPAQSNDPACKEPMCNIARICAAMTNATLGDEVQRLAHVRAVQRGHRKAEHHREEEEEAEKEDEEEKEEEDRMEEKLAEAPGANSSKHAEREVPAPGYNDGEKLWPWQTCNEFGFYQTCELGSECFFTQGLNTLQEEMSFCNATFGISTAAVVANIVATNAFYGADHPTGSKVFYVNGEVDPWRANSILSPVQPSLPVLNVDGASHHFWTHPSLPTDQSSVVSARHAIRVQVWHFLDLSPAPAQAPGPLSHVIERMAQASAVAARSSGFFVL